MGHELSNEINSRINLPFPHYREKTRLEEQRRPALCALEPDKSLAFTGCVTSGKSLSGSVPHLQNADKIHGAVMRIERVNHVISLESGSL